MTVTARTCACGNPLRNQAQFCRDCEAWARRRLADQFWLHQQLDTERLKQTRKQAPSEGGRSDEQPLPFSPAAAELQRQQIAWLSRWWIVVDAQLPNSPQPVSSVPGVATYLATHLRTIRRHPDGARFITSLRTLHRRILRVIDSPENRTRIHVGPCPEVTTDNDGNTDHCPGEVEAIVPADEAVPAIMRCRECRTEWPAAQWNRTGHRITQRAAQLARQKQLAQAITGGTAA